MTSQQAQSYSRGSFPGASIYGSRVAPTSMPNPALDLSNQFPRLSEANNNISGVINSELSGSLSPDTVDMIKNAGATWGVQSGMPGSQLNLNGTARNLGLTSQSIQRQGVQDYNSTIPTISRTQTVDPALQNEINFQNNVSAAAPDPAAAGSYAQGLFQQYLDNLGGGNKSPLPSNGVGSDRNTYSPWNYDAARKGVT